MHRKRKPSNPTCPTKAVVTWRKTGKMGKNRRRHQKYGTSQKNGSAFASLMDTTHGNGSSRYHNSEGKGGIFANNRKRPLVDVKFVTSRDNGRKEYIFGSSSNKESFASPGDHDDATTEKATPLNQKTESLDDILNPGRKQEEQRAEVGRELEHSNSRMQSIPNEAGGHMSGLSVEDAVRDKTGLRPRANSTDGELNLPQRGLCDERAVLEAYRWLPMNVQVTTPKGLVNLGNTCFLNSTLQCLAYLPPFCQSLLAMSSSLRGNNSTGKRMTQSIRSLFTQIHGLNGGPKAGGALAPKAIVNALPSLGSCGSRHGYKFRPGRQEDAHEFLVHLLDAMNDGELKEAGIDQNKSGWREKLPVPRLDETTFVHRIFGGYFRSQVHCTACKFNSNTYDPFLDLSLEVSRKGCRSVADALREFTRKETLDSANRWKCSKCKRKVCAVKQLTVFRPPLSLCIQLKRFSFGDFDAFNAFSGFGGSNHGGRKIAKQIDFPAVLKLPLSDQRSCRYVLSGIVIHVGGSASSGHYTAYVRKSNKGGKFQWYHVDDSFVEACSEHTVLRQNDAYLLFYSRQEVKLELPQVPMSTAEAREFGRAKARALSQSEDDMVVKGTDQVRSNGSESKPSGRTPKQAASQGPSLNNIKEDDSSSDSESSSSSSSSSTSSSSESSSSSSSDESNANRKEGSSKMSRNDCAPGTPDTDAAVIARRSPGDDSSTPSSRTDDGRWNSDNKTTGATEKGVTSKPQKPPSVIVSRGPGREKVEVVTNVRKKKVWKPKSTPLSRTSDDFALLGNQQISKWDDDSDSESPEKQAEQPANGDSRLQERKTIVRQIDKTANTRKRKMFLDRWDSILDQGKTKKVKKKVDANPYSRPNASGNRFDAISRRIRRMNKGKAKGTGGAWPNDRKK